MITQIYCIKQFATGSDTEIFPLIIDDEKSRYFVTFNAKELTNETVANGLRQLADKIDATRKT